MESDRVTWNNLTSWKLEPAEVKLNPLFLIKSHLFEADTTCFYLDSADVLKIRRALSNHPAFFSQSEALFYSEAKH